MEDAHTIQLPVDSDSDSAFFAVFDGHGGSRFATYCSEHLHKELLSNTNFSRSHSQALPILEWNRRACISIGVIRSWDG